MSIRYGEPGYSDALARLWEQQMLSTLLLATGSAIPILWGVAHLMPTRAIVDAFGPISSDNRRILTMEWVAEGLGLIFIGVLCGLMLLLFGQADACTRLVYRAAAVMLLVLGSWTAVTGARTPLLPYKLCPFILGIAAVSLFLGASI